MCDLRQQKVRANEAFSRHAYPDAIVMFTNILNDAAIGEADAEFQSTVLANRSLCSLKVGDAVAALADARRCTQLRPVWPKAHYRLLSALLALNLKQDAYRHARSLKRDLVASEDDLRALVESISRAFIEDVHYSAHREATRVRFIDIARGKGLFTSESVRPLTALVVESPLASVANFNIDKSVHEFCDHCMQTRLSAKALGGGELVELLYGSSGAPSWTACRAAPACSMRYCSSACRDAAWSSYHEALCAGSVHIGSEQSLQRQAALAAIQALAVKSNRRNVWLIARLLAREVCGQARVAAREQVSRELQSHDNFVYAPDAAEPSDAELVVLLRRLLGATSCVTEQRVAVLNGVIGYNASDCAPVSDLHKLLLRMPLAQRATTLRRLDGVVRGEADVRDELLSDVPSLKRLCIVGCGLYEYINVCNNSCEPNAFVASTGTTHALTLISARALARDEEILISYDDETAARAQRRAYLRDKYGFECMCAKCARGQ